MVYMALGKIDLAVQHYRRSLELKPDEPRVHSNLLLCLHYVPELPDQVGSLGVFGRPLVAGLWVGGEQRGGQEEECGRAHGGSGSWGARNLRRLQPWQAGACRRHDHA